MTPKKILVCVGTRPDAVKLAPLIIALKKDERFQCSVCATGQHQEMLYQILDWFDIQPDTRLDVMAHKQPLSHLAGRLLNGLHSIMENERPEIVAVCGDTTSSFIAGLAGLYGYDFENHKPIEIAHVEAGLRTYDMYAPFPEEANRRLLDHLSTWHFAPTLTAAEALYEENITERVFITGNTVIDALFETLDMLKEAPRNPFPQIPLDNRIVLVTGHRRENYGAGFDNICQAIRHLAEKYPNDHFVYPVHLNPHVREPVMKHLHGIDNVHLCNPLDYPDFVAAMQRSQVILTDSGGVQEEAPSLGKPVLVMRDVTERPDAVMANTVKVVGTDTQKIINETSRLLDDPTAYDAMAKASNPYGDGRAVERILNILAGERSEINTFKPTIHEAVA